jgi:hypothetical protein
MTNAKTLSPSITSLLEIMSGDGLMRRKLESAEVLLSYETPSSVGEYVRSFLTGIIEDRAGYQRLSIEGECFIASIRSEEDCPANDWIRLVGSLERSLAPDCDRAQEDATGKSWTLAAAAGLVC